MQNASGLYAERLEAHSLRVSMSRAGHPPDNAKAERFMKTLETVEANGKDYKNLEDARAHIGAFHETVCNAKRLPSALGCKPPEEFEAELRWNNQRRRDKREPLSLNWARVSHWGAVQSKSASIFFCLHLGTISHKCERSLGVSCFESRVAAAQAPREPFQGGRLD